MTRDEKGEIEREESKMELSAGRSFTGYRTALAVSELSALVRAEQPLIAKTTRWS